jgi:hypothetical protein
MEPLPPLHNLLHVRLSSSIFALTAFPASVSDPFNIYYYLWTQSAFVPHLKNVGLLRHMVNMLERFDELHLLNLEIEYEVRKWRMIRFPCVIEDVHTNTGSQSPLEFLTWANKKRDLQRFYVPPAFSG